MASHNAKKDEEHAMTEPGLAVYFTIYILLLVGVVFTVLVAYVDLHGWNTPAALAIAVTKAALVVLYFMHVRYGIRLTWLVAAGGFVWLALLFTFTFSDYLSRAWLETPIYTMP